MRIRLEGALETQEKATERYRWARGIFAEPWRSRAGLHRSALERLKAEEPLVEQALSKTLRTIEREGWPRDCEPAQVAERTRRARLELITCLEPLVGQPSALTDSGRVSDGYATGRLGWLLESALGELLAPTRAPPMMTATLGNLEVLQALPGVVGAIVFGLGWALYEQIRVGWLFALGALVLGVVTPFLLWRNVTRLEVLPDRLRLKRLLERAIETPLPRGGILYDPLTAQVKIAGFGPLTFHSVEEASALATLIELCSHPPFDQPQPQNADGSVVDAEWNPNQPGALLLTKERAHFLLDGEATFDAATQRKLPWPNPKARLLGQALLSLSDAARAEVLRQLRELGRAIELRVLPEETITLSRGVLRVGNRLTADVGDRLARDIRSWAAAQRKREAGAP